MGDRRLADVEIEGDEIAHLERVRARGQDMDGNAAEVRNVKQRVGVVHQEALNFAPLFLVAHDGDGFDPARRPDGHVPLVEVLARDTVGVTHESHGSVA